MLESVKQAKIGSIVPIYKEIDTELDAFEYFTKLSNYGKKKNSVFLEDNSKSIGTANPCLVAIGKGEEFEIRALNNLGTKFLAFIKKDFGFCDKAVYHKDKIYGNLTPSRRIVSEQERLESKTHMDVIRQIAFKFKPVTKLMPYSGMFGVTSYDFQFEGLQDNEQDPLKDPDYILYFLDNMFLINHITKKTYFVANALVTDNNKEKIYDECIKTIKIYEKLIDKKAPEVKKPKKKELKISYDMDKNEFLTAMNILNRHIHDGNILYAPPSRTAISTYNAEPLDIYTQLKNINPGFTFYINDGYGLSVGSEGNTSLSAKGESEKIVELKISTSAKPLGIVKGDAGRDIDNKCEALLKVDENENAYNIMVADAARNDIARISELGTRYVDKMFDVEKQDGFQSLITSVKGILKKNLDALDAFNAALTPPIINGYSKIRSLQLLRKTEKVKRCFNSGSLVYINPDKDFYGMAISPIRIKKDKAYITASSRVFNNSNDEYEIKSSEAKTSKLLYALKSAGGQK